MKPRRLVLAVSLSLLVSGLLAAGAGAAPTAYVSAESASPKLYVEDLETRTGSEVGLIAGLNPVEALAMSGSDVLYAVGGPPSPKLVEIDKATAQARTVFNLTSLNGLDATLPGLAFGPEESLWLASDAYVEHGGELEVEAELSHLDPLTKSVSSSNRAGAGETALEALAGGCDGTMYAAVDGPSGRELDRIALPGAGLTPVGQIAGPGGSEDFDMAFDHSTEILYGISENGALYEIDPASGAVTSLGQLKNGLSNLVEIHGFAIDSPSACPPPKEPPAEEGGSKPPSGGPPGGGLVSPEYRCLVPKLKGKPLSKAKATLRAAHCGVGKVRKPRRRADRKSAPLVVGSSTPPAGGSLPAGAPVRLKMVPKRSSRR